MSPAENMRRAYLKHCYLAWPKRRRMLLVVSAALLIMYLISTLNQKKQQIWMFVVEEHHEVLRYWHHFGVTGKLNRTGNTLIHIDGHSDMAAPEYIEGFPFFKWPAVEPQLFGFMQKNDVFIQGAILMGLINRVVWIYPSWDRSDEFGEHAIFRFDIGLYNATIEGKKQVVFCECHTKVEKNLELPIPGEKTHCVYLDETKGINEGEIRISKKKCHVKKSAILEVIVDDRAVEVLEKRSWVERLGKNIMLDIDEDYFGCERGSTPLEKAKVPWETVELIDELSNEIICAKNVLHEEVGDRIMKDFIADYIQNCALSETGVCKVEFDTLLSEIKKPVLRKFLETPRMFCHDSRETTELLGQLMKALKKLTLKHLQEITKLGFCFVTSPSTFGFEDGRSEFHICHGANTPNDTVVVLHTAKEKELNNRMTLLHKMLRPIHDMRPKVVTLCRSVRDGYTPRHQVTHIESNILQFFKAVNDVKYEIMYDDNLLGREGGWDSRYQPKIS